MNLPLLCAIRESPLRTQVRVAAATGIAEQRLSRIVNGWIRPRPKEQDAIANVIGKPVAELFGHITGGSAAA